MKGMSNDGCYGMQLRVCADCGDLVRINKPILGSLHICVTECERRGHHSGPYFELRRVGPFWNRRNQYRCWDCHEIVPDPTPMRVIREIS